MPTTGPPLPACPAPTTLREQLSELVMVSLRSNDPAAGVRTLLANPFLGGVFLGGNDDRIILDPTFQQTARSGRWFVAVDDEGGRVQRVDHIVGDLPAAAVQAGLDAGQIREVARARGVTLRNLGINVDFAPVVDLSAALPGLIIGDRSYSPSAAVVETDAGAFAEGLRAGGVMPTLKHFPGHGRASGDSHAGPVLTPTLDDLGASDLLPYEDLPKQGLTAVMVGHLDVPGLTERGVPSSLSPAAYRLLRGGVGFGGVAFTDELADMKAVSSRFDAPTAVVAAIAAGADVALLARPDPAPYISALERAVSRGHLSTARVTEAVNRVLATKVALGLGGCA
ncbi:MAG: glycoside hydrolase family 3 N-terminal domain-containing protein [Acidimicrobiales bacterium]